MIKFRGKHKGFSVGSDSKVNQNKKVYPRKLQEDSFKAEPDNILKIVRLGMVNSQRANIFTDNHEGNIELENKKIAKKIDIAKLSPRQLIELDACTRC